jgi:hypothetical protein
MEFLEYQNECSQTRYPFRDSATLLWTNGGNKGVLPTNILDDAVLTLSTSPGTLKLSTIIYNGTTWQFNFTGATALSITVTPGTGINTFSTRSGLIALRIDVDLDQISSYFTTNSLTAGTYTFDSTNLLCNSAIKFLPPQVTGVQFYNTTSSSPALIADVTSGTLALSEGANTSFNVVDNVVEVVVNPGAGEGLYVNCPESNISILSINNTGPNSAGNYFLNNDNCYAITNSANALLINNNCQAQCQPADLISTTHYINRIVDATTQIYVGAETAGTNYNSFVATYTAYENTKVIPPPYVLARTSTLTATMNYYDLITAGVYNPENVVVNGTLTITFDSHFTSLAGSAYVLQNNVKQLQSTALVSGGAIFSGFALNPTSVTNCGLNLSQPIPNVNNGSTIYDILFTLSTGAVPQQSSGYILPIQPNLFNFNLAYAITRGAVTTIAFQIEPFDSLFPALSSSTLTVTLPSSSFTTTSSILTLNGTANTLSGAGYASELINYQQNNTYALVVQCASTVLGPQTFIFAGSDTNGSTTKTVNITL